MPHGDCSQTREGESCTYREAFQVPSSASFQPDLHHVFWPTLVLRTMGMLSIARRARVLADWRSQHDGSHPLRDMVVCSPQCFSLKTCNTCLSFSLRLPL